MMKKEKNIQVVHALPGRVRLKVSRLKHNTAYAAEIQRALLKVSGITHLEANPQTGSLLIEYLPNILEVLDLHPSVSSCLGQPSSKFNPSGKKRPPAKGRIKTLKTGRKDKPKIKEKATPKKSPKKIRGKS